MAQHATIHGKTTTPVNGQSGSWIPVVVDGNGNVGVNMASYISGELPQYGRLAGGAVAQWYNLTATGLPTGWTGGGIIYDIRCLAVGGNITGLYDAASAAGTNFFTTALAPVANAVTPLASPGVGVIFNTSPWFVLTGGTWVVFGVPAV